MEPSVAPLISALSTATADLTGRVADLARRLDTEETQGVAAELFEVERLLRNADRRLERARRAAG